MMHSAITLYCMGLDSIMHHEAWLKKSEVRSADRSVHEHSSLCRVLHVMESIDIEYRPWGGLMLHPEESLGVRDQTDGSTVDS